MKLFTQAIHARLLKNGTASQAAEGGIDHAPVVKLFTPDAAATWLLSEIDSDNPTLAFGLADLGMGCPELGAVDLTEISEVRGRLGLPVERDRYFTGTYPLSVYAEAARSAECITEDSERLAHAAMLLETRGRGR
jgi:hypothetical protein